MGDEGDEAKPPARAFIAWPEDVRRSFRELSERLVALELQHDELTRAHAELDRLRARYTDLFDVAPIGYCVIDATNGVLQANLALEALIGAERKAMKAQPLTRFIDPADRDAFALARARLDATGAPQWVDVRVRRGELPIWVSMALIEARDGRNNERARDTGWGTGARTCRVAVLDATERKAREQAAAARDVERSQSAKMEAVERFAGAVGSELDEVFGFITEQVERAASAAGVPPPVRAMHAEILDAARQGARVTQRIALGSRADRVALARMDLGALLGRLEPKLVAIAGAEIELILDIPPDPLEVLADAGLLEELLVQLVLNAREAMATGGVLFVVASARAADEHELEEGQARGRARLQVIDVGGGIAPEDLPRVFDPYFTTKHGERTRGLGLASAFRIVARFGGSISVQSELGRGSKFEVLFPAAAEAPAALAPLDALGEARAPARGGSESVLVVEPDEAIRAAACAALAGAGYEVTSATDGSTALAAWERASRGPQLLVTDGKLTGALTGHELAEQLREEAPGLRVLFTSEAPAPVKSSERPRSDVFRIRFLLPKPFDMGALLVMVRRCLDA